MRKLPVICVVATLALLAAAAFTASGDSPSVSSSHPVVAPAIGGSPQPVQAPAPSPGLYKAAPFTVIVVVPKPVDSGMVVAISDTARFRMPCLQPQLRLEPMTPDISPKPTPGGAMVSR